MNSIQNPIPLKGCSFMFCEVDLSSLLSNGPYSDLQSRERQALRLNCKNQAFASKAWRGNRLENVHLPLRGSPGLHYVRLTRRLCGVFNVG